MLGTITQVISVTITSVKMTMRSTVGSRFGHQAKRRSP